MEDPSLIRTPILVFLPRPVKHTCQILAENYCWTSTRYGCGKQDAKDSGKDQAASEQADKRDRNRKKYWVWKSTVCTQNWRVLTEIVNGGARKT